MIYLYYGKIGDGKTYHVMFNELLPAVRDGRKIYTNIDNLDDRHIRMLTGKDPIIVKVSLSEEFKKMMECEPEDKEGKNISIDHGSLVIIDEAQLIWDAREHKNTSKKFLTMLEYHRHFGLDLVFITQNPKRLEAAVTRLANNSYQVKNLGFLFGPLSNRYVLHIRQTPFDRDIVATMRGKFQKPVFACYRSAVVGRVGKHSAKRKTALQGGYFMFLAMLGVFMAFMFISRGGFHILTPMKIPQQGGAANVSTIPAQGGAVVPAVQSGKVASSVSDEKVRHDLTKKEPPECIEAGYMISDGVRHDYLKCGKVTIEKVSAAI